MKDVYARALCLDAGATLDDRRKAVTTLEDAERIARRVFGGSNPLTKGIVGHRRRGRKQIVDKISIGNPLCGVNQIIGQAI